MSEPSRLPEYYSISEAAAVLQVSRQSIWRWVRAGRLPIARLGHRTTRIARRDLERLLTDPAGIAAEARTHVDAAGGVNRHPLASPEPPDGASSHRVQFYESDGFLAGAVGAYLAAGLRAGEAVIVVATAEHRASFEEVIGAAGVDIAAERSRGHYIALDAAETLEQFMRDGLPDAARFAEVFGGLIVQAAMGGRRVRIFGEMVALLVIDGNETAAIQLEALWNDLRAAYPFALLCAYAMEHLSGAPYAGTLGEICAAHSGVIPAESYATLTDADARDRIVTTLQQQARSLQVSLIEAQAAREAAEAALHVRDVFLSVAAHELRTPLTILAGRAQLALRQADREDQQVPAPLVQSLQAISAQAAKLNRLLTHLLDASRLERDVLMVERQPIDLSALVRDVVSEARSWSDRHPITLDAPPGIEIAADPLRLEQVLTNLLDNAVKFSPDGGSIDVAVTREHPWVAITVRDHGLGVPPERRDALFDRFSQAHASSHRSGLGLGLYLCRQIAALHGGDISADFPSDGGTRFTVRLPTAADA